MKFTMDERRKHQLIGVVVMIAIAAIFIPAFIKNSMDNNMDERMTLTIHLPPKPTVPKIVKPNPEKVFASVKVAELHLSNEQPIPEKRLYTVKAEPINSVNTLPKNIQVAKISTDKATTITPSKAAKSPALAKVITPTNSTTPQAFYAVQIASFTVQQNAQLLVKNLQKKGYKAMLTKVNGQRGEFYKVIVGQLKEKKAAHDLKLKLAGNYNMNGFVVKVGEG